MINGFLGIKGVDGAYWTLAYELRFYFFIFMILLLKKKDKLKEFTWMWLGACIVILILELFKETLFPLKFLKYAIIPDFAAPFIAGVFFAMVFKNKKDRVSWAGIVFSVVYSFIIQDNSFSILLLFACVYFIFVLFFHNRIKKWKFIYLLKPIAILSEISYPLYLLHQNIGFSIISKMIKSIDNHTLIIVICSILMITVSYFVHEYYEKPITRKLKAL